METIPKLSGIQVDLWIKNRDGSDEELDRYFIHKFKELGLDVDAPRKRKVKSRVDMRVQKEKKSKTDDENIIVRKPTTHAS